MGHWIWSMVIGCSDSSQNGELKTYSSIDDVNIVDTTATNTTTSTTTETDTDPDHPDNVVNFVTNNVDCEKLARHTLTVTRMTPGELNSQQNEDLSTVVTDDITALFYEQKTRLVLAEATLNPVLAEGQESTDSAANCSFALTLPAPEDTELVPVSGDEEESELTWAFYYLAMYVGQDVECDQETMSCTSNDTTGQTTAPDATDFDPELAGNDFYDWSSDIYLVYISGELTGSFEDMGFQQGWNMAHFSGSDITEIQAVSEGEAGSLMPISIEIDNLLPRYQISAEGTKLGIDTSLIDGYTLGARPLPWLSGVAESAANSAVNPIDLQFRVSASSPNDTANFQIYLWGMPPANHFFPSTYSSSHNMYQQWAEYVDIAPEVPVVFSGEPSTIAEEDLLLGDTINYDAELLGALCLSTDRLIFAYFDPPDRPSETLWYRLIDEKFTETKVRPGWHALNGTEGEPSTWRFVIEDGNSESYTYGGLSIGVNCTVFPEWQ